MGVGEGRGGGRCDPDSYFFSLYFREKNGQPSWSGILFFGLERSRMAYALPQFLQSPVSEFHSSESAPDIVKETLQCMISCLW